MERNMKSLMRLALVGILALTVSGCAGLATLRKVDEAGVTPQQAYVARSSFVVAEKAGTRYLNFCTANAAKNYASCSRSIQSAVVVGIRDGRTASRGLKNYMAKCPGTGKCALPTYDNLISITSTISGIVGNH
jgi:hypothetical protein